MLTRCRKQQTSRFKLFAYRIVHYTEPTEDGSRDALINIFFTSVYASWLSSEADLGIINILYNADQCDDQVGTRHFDLQWPWDPGGPALQFARFENARIRVYVKNIKYAILFSKLI